MVEEPSVSRHPTTLIEMDSEFHTLDLDRPDPPTACKRLTYTAMVLTMLLSVLAGSTIFIGYLAKGMAPGGGRRYADEDDEIFVDSPQYDTYG